jgi:hypothetical protein
MSNTMNERLLFKASAIVEVLTGLALLVAPQFVIGLLLGDGLGAIGIAVARVLGSGCCQSASLPGNRRNSIAGLPRGPDFASTTLV